MLQTKLNQKGFSVIEIIISLTVFSFIMVIMGQLLISTQKTSSLIRTEIDLRDGNRNTQAVLAYELRKAIYFYPDVQGAPTTFPNKNIIIPKAVTDLNDTVKVANSNFPNLANDTSGNITTFISVDSTEKLSKIKPSDYLVCSRGFANNTANPVFNQVVNLDNLLNNVNIQLVKVNCIFLKKNNSGSFDLTMYQQSGFFNSNPKNIIFSEPIDVQVPLAGMTKAQTIELAKTELNNRILYVLESNKNYTSIGVPDSNNIFSTDLASVPSLDFSLNNANTSMQNLNATKNGRFVKLASDIGLDISGTSTAITYNPVFNSFKYKAGINLNPSNLSIINTDSAITPDKLGFRIKYLNDSGNTISIALDNIKYSPELRRAISGHSEFSIRPKLSF